MKQTLLRSTAIAAALAYRESGRIDAPAPTRELPTLDYRRFDRALRDPHMLSRHHQRLVRKDPFLTNKGWC